MTVNVPGHVQLGGVRRPSRSAFPVLIVLLGVVTIACGKKGPPLPPLVKIPVAPGDATAARRGNTVDLQFSVPNANTDNSRPANIERVDVYGLTGPSGMTDDQLIKYGKKVASVRVKAPRNPNATIDEDEPEEDMDAPEGSGLEQGASAVVEEDLTADVFAPVDLPKSRKTRTDIDISRPLDGAPPTVPARTYVMVGVNNRGRKGAVSKRVAVPLIALPPAPAAPTITYDEKTITVTWTPVPTAAPVQEEATGDILRATPIGWSRPTRSYRVYDVAPSTDGKGAPSAAASLTKTPLSDPPYQDTRIEWGVERCYVVRSVETVGGLALESEPSPPACKKLVDTFPPAQPRGLKAVSSSGTISLIWEPNQEPDLAGYLVFRGVSPGEPTTLVTPAPITDAIFSDTVQAGVTYVYVVKAVDKAGNASAPSERATETARQ